MGKFYAGGLRHRISIEEQHETQDTDTGDLEIDWAVVNEGLAQEWSSIPAKVRPMTGREFIAAQAEQWESPAAIEIRYRAGVTNKMRAVYNGVPYNIRGIQPDADSGREWLTLMCSAGPDKGG